MRIAIFMANTDESAFAQRHPKDGAKFTDLMALARPHWTYPVFAVKDGVFPTDLGELDGVIITGSPASANAGEPWMQELEALIRTLLAREIPIFGACFGHQIVAKAVGGRVARNPQGWVKGVVQADYAEGPLLAYASHTEQVVDLPAGAEMIASSAGCPVAAFRIPGQVETTQYHPEMTPEFFEALLEEVAPTLPAKVVDQARASLAAVPSREAWAARMTRFFETLAVSPAKT
ncbi:MAG: type 1 glutamine amidotransferase [Pseudomonadota bacterium]